MTDRMESITMNRILADMLKLPPDTYRATLVIEANELPRLTVERLVFRSGQVVPLAPESFKLVPEKIGAGGTAS